MNGAQSFPFLFFFSQLHSLKKTFSGHSKSHSTPPSLGEAVIHTNLLCISGGSGKIALNMRVQKCTEVAVKEMLSGKTVDLG